MSHRKLLIVGGGFAGMALAIRMRAIGWSVDLVELDPQWRVYGAGITITGPTYRASKRLGVIDDLVSLGYGSHAGVRICAPDGHVIVQMPPQPIEAGLPTNGGIMRPVLQDILSRRTRTSGVDVRLGVTLESFTEVANAVRVVTSDGETREYTLVVGADGAFSSVRNLLFPAAAKPKYTGQYCWRLVADRPPEIDGVHIYMAGPVTAGLTPASATQMYMFLLNPLAAKERLEETTQWRRLKELMAPFSGLIGSLRDGLSASSSIICRPLEAILLPRPWHRGRVLLIGDAVHATTPHLASGAGIAIEDGLVLSEELSREENIERALTRFEERRWERCRIVVENSVRIGEMEQTHGDPAALNALMAESEAALRQDI